MTKHRVNYDQIAPSYDQRFISDRSEGVGRALLDLAQRLGANRVLEVGCGTCHWLSQMHPVAQELYGLDLSAGMLKRAQSRWAQSRWAQSRWAQSRKTQARLVRGYAEHLPFANDRFDLAFCVNAIHHFGDARRFISEAYRILKPSGVLAVVGTDPHGRRESWYIYHYFEGTYKVDMERFPPWETVLAWMDTDGFERPELREVERILDVKRGREVLDAPFLRKNSVSQLALLSEEAYAAGLERIEAALEEAEARGETLVFRSDIILTMLVGYKTESVTHSTGVNNLGMGCGSASSK